MLESYTGDGYSVYLADWKLDMDWADDNAFLKIRPCVEEVRLVSHNGSQPCKATKLKVAVFDASCFNSERFKTARAQDLFNTERDALLEVEKRFKSIFSKLWESA